LSGNHGSNALNLFKNQFIGVQLLQFIGFSFRQQMKSPFQKDQSQKMICLAETPRWKRSLDIVFILMILPVVLPLCILVAAVIRMVSKGPVLFQQERVGYLGRKFMCFKFRTMVVGAETTTHEGHLQLLMNSDLPLVKLDARGDSRIISFGLLLRSTGLDELPQLINVLRGEMSMVGPRPCLPYEGDNYLPWQRERFNTLPGLTGLWQVSGKNQTTFAEMMRLDISYTRERTLWLDLNIILKTIPAIIGQVLEARKRKRMLPLEAQAPRSYQPNL
jgi:exopolysaccharide production protein ExoY